MLKVSYGFRGKWNRGAASFDDAKIELAPRGTEISIVGWAISATGG